MAVKIQKPDIAKAVRSDLDMLEWLAERLHANLEELRYYDLPALIAETRTAMRQELDFTVEARNVSFFNNTNPDPENIFAPAVYEELTSRRLMVSAWVEGGHPGEIELDREQQQRLARLGGESIFHQIILSGFFHADPHTGNIIITPDRRLCFLDWGLAGQLTREMRYFLADLFSAVASQNPEKVVRVVMLMTQGYQRLDKTSLEKEVSFVLRKFNNFTTESEALGRVFLEMIRVLGRNGVYLARDYALLGKAVMSIEEAGMQIDPDFDVRTIAKPYLEKLNWERHSPRTVLRQAYWTALSTLHQVRELPGEVQRVMRSIESGRLSVNMEHHGLDGLSDTLKTVANRLTLAIIIGSLLIGCSLVITTDVRPYLWGYPAIGIVGFLVSALLGSWLIYDTIKHRRHK